ncbi:MAG TPA: hypothetical protein VGD40_26470, partial [Chryseosolibacter sp.]
NSKSCLRGHETAIENRFMLLSKPGVTPVPQFTDLICYQHLDSLTELLLEQESVKTHFGEHSFDIVQHFDMSKG